MSRKMLCFWEDELEIVEEKEEETATKYIVSNFFLISSSSSLLKVRNVNDLTNVFYKSNMPCLWFVWSYNASFFFTTGYILNIHQQSIPRCEFECCFFTRSRRRHWISFVCLYCIGLRWYQLYSYANPYPLDF